jgi:hypothetical protein
MPSQPIIVIPRRQTTAQDELTRIMASEKLSQGVAGFSDMINKGIAAYQDAKLKTQQQQIASINASASLIGGVDRLPQDTLNKLPGILGVDLPRDPQGNVMVTPSAQDLINRATADAAKADPVGFGRVHAGIQDKAPDPESLKLDREKNEAKIAGDQLTAETKKLEIDSQNARTAFEQAQQNERNRVTNETTRETAGASADIRAQDENAPSGLYIDRTTGKTMDKKSAEMMLGIDEKFDSRFWQPSNRQLKQRNDADMTNARVAHEANQTELDNTRLQLMQTRIKAVGAKQPDLFKAALDGLRKAQIADNADSSEATRGAVQHYTSEIQRLYGMEATPEEYTWSLKHFNELVSNAWSWYKGTTGDSTGPAPKVTAPGDAAAATHPGPAKPTPMKAGATPPAGSTTGALPKDPNAGKTLDDLLNQYHH